MIAAAERSNPFTTPSRRASDEHPRISGSTSLASFKEAIAPTRRCDLPGAHARWLLARIARTINEVIGVDGSPPAISAEHVRPWDLAAQLAVASALLAGCLPIAIALVVVVMAAVERGAADGALPRRSLAVYRYA